MIKDLHSAIDYIRVHRNEKCISVGKRVRNRIITEMTALHLVIEGPRPPDGDPDQFWFDQRRGMQKLARVYIMGTELLV